MQRTQLEIHARRVDDLRAALKAIQNQNARPDDSFYLDVVIGTSGAASIRLHLDLEGNTGTIFMFELAKFLQQEETRALNVLSDAMEGKPNDSH